MFDHLHLFTKVPTCRNTDGLEPPAPLLYGVNPYGAHHQVEYIVGCQQCFSLPQKCFLCLYLSPRTSRSIVSIWTPEIWPQSRHGLEIPGCRCQHLSVIAQTTLEEPNQCYVIQVPVTINRPVSVRCSQCQSVYHICSPPKQTQHFRMKRHPRVHVKLGDEAITLST